MGDRRADGVVLYVIDGDRSVREALCRLVAASGFEARPHGSVRDFAVAPVDERPGCVLVDAAALVDARSPSVSGLGRDRLPVIVLGDGERGDARTFARSHGARFFLNKPVDAQALFDVIAWVMEAPGAGEAGTTR